MEPRLEALTLSVAPAEGKVFPELSSGQAAVMVHLLEAPLGKVGIYSSPANMCLTREPRLLGSCVRCLTSDCGNNRSHKF